MYSPSFAFPYAGGSLPARPCGRTGSIGLPSDGKRGTGPGLQASLTAWTCPSFPAVLAVTFHYNSFFLELQSPMCSKSHFFSFLAGSSRTRFRRRLKTWPTSRPGVTPACMTSLPVTARLRRLKQSPDSRISSVRLCTCSRYAVSSCAIPPARYFPPPRSPLPRRSTASA